MVHKGRLWRVAAATGMVLVLAGCGGGSTHQVVIRQSTPITDDSALCVQIFGSSSITTPGEHCAGTGRG